MRRLLLVFLATIAVLYSQTPISVNVWEYKAQRGGTKWQSWVDQTGVIPGYFLVDNTISDSSSSGQIRFAKENIGFFSIYLKIDSIANASATDSVRYRLHTHNGIDWQERGILQWDREIPNSFTVADSNITWIVDKHNGMELVWSSSPSNSALSDGHVYKRIRIERILGSGDNDFKEYMRLNASQ